MRDEVQLDTVLTLRLGAAEREFDARVTYLGGPFQVDIQAIEILLPVGGWMAAPWLIRLVEGSAPLVDELREHWSGRVAAGRAAAVALRAG